MFMTSLDLLRMFLIFFFGWGCSELPKSEAVQTVFHASLFAVFIWCYSVFLIFQILHSPDHASTALRLQGSHGTWLPLNHDPVTSER